MFAWVKKLFTTDTPADHSEEQKQLALALVLLEVSYADYDIAEVEIEWVRRGLRSVYNLSQDEIQQLTDQALARHPEETSMYPWVRILNETLSLADKEKVVAGLWSVAYADGQLEALEEHRVRRLADMLYIPHTTFMRLKAEVQAQPGNSA